MSTFKQSLEANQAEILANLPKEFHQDFEKQMASAPAAPAPITGEAEVAAIKAELAANPAVNESEAAPELKNIQVSAPLAPASEAQLATEQAELLAKAKAMGAHTPQED